jgi:outer membrane protein OmpA-like peptidoglycan-associated protein
MALQAFLCTLLEILRHMSLSNLLRLSLVLGICLLWASLGIAQKKNHTDHKPQYRPWQDDYILDKIEYTADRTIFYFRFVCKPGKFVSAIFYPPGGKHPWYLRGKNVPKNFDLKEIRNVRRNGVLMAQRVSSELTIPAIDNAHTIFSCEVHFERLPNDVTLVDLIEGRGQEYNRNHFNCFDVKIKTFNDKDLGSENDSQSQVRKFEERFGVRTTPPPPPPPKPTPPKPTPPKPTPPKPEPPKVDTPKVEPKPLKEDETPIFVNEANQPQPRTENPTQEKPKPQPQPALNPQGVKILNKKEDIVCGEKLLLNKVQFQDNSPNFKSLVWARQVLDLVVDFMKEHPKSTLIVMGHTDIFGNKERNKELSYQRALSVQKYISGMGINPKRIEVQYFGGEQPMIPEGHADNRRVELIFRCNE